jgi:hypothetical protein
MKTVAILLAGALMTVAGSASAATLTRGTLGQVETGRTLFADYDTLTPAPSAFSNSSVFGPTGASGQAAPIDGNMPSNFYAVLGGGFTTYTFAQPVSSFSFDAGSLDAYNFLTINYLGGTSQTFDGSGVVGQTFRAIFTADGAERIAGVTFSSDQNSFEIDNIAIGGAVPEPATWAMMIGGFGMVGGAMRRRTSKLVAA